jgi:hypothetical protein
MDYLGDLGITKSAATSSSAQLFLELVPDLEALPDLSHSEFVQHVWGKIVAAGEDGQTIRGSLFELLISSCLVRASILPFYVQAKVEFVPNVFFDFLIWTQENGPISISAKTSLRERYKQADLEAMALGNVHRRARSYLITLDALEAARVKSKIAAGDVFSLTDVVIATSSQFDEFITMLQGETCIAAPQFSAVPSGNFVARRNPNPAPVDVD